MVKNLLCSLMLCMTAASAMAEQGICKTMASLAKMSAEQRDAGVPRDALLRRLVQEGKLETGDAATPFVLNTVVWVYEERVPVKSAYKEMQSKCDAALAKRR